MVSCQGGDLYHLCHSNSIHQLNAPALVGQARQTKLILIAAWPLIQGQTQHPATAHSRKQENHTTDSYVTLPCVSISQACWLVRVRARVRARVPECVPECVPEPVPECVPDPSVPSFSPQSFTAACRELNTIIPGGSEEHSLIMVLSNLGGSITGVLAVTAIALGVRLLIIKRSRRSAHGDTSAQQPPRTPPRFLGTITAAALRLLIETDAVPHVIVQISQPTEPPPLPPSLNHHAVTLTTLNFIDVLLGNTSQWRSYWPSAQGTATDQRGLGQASDDAEPRQGELACVVTSSAATAHMAACALAANGFHRVTITIADANGDSHLRAAHTPLDAPEPTADAAVHMAMLGHVGAPLWGGQAIELSYMSRDGLAALLGYRQYSLGVPHVLIDVRRHDERSLYGLVRGSLHVPVEQLPSALLLPPEEFLSLYRFPRPQPGLPVVLLGRTSRRAAWAAQLCEDAGLWPVFVYRQGTYGWRLDEAVQPYRQYRVGDRPPEPELFQPEVPDEDKGEAELVNLGLLQRVH